MLIIILAAWEVLICQKDEKQQQWCWDASLYFLAARAAQTVFLQRPQQWEDPASQTFQEVRWLANLKQKVKIPCFTRRQGLTSSAARHIENGTIIQTDLRCKIVQIKKKKISNFNSFQVWLNATGKKKKSAFTSFHVWKTAHLNWNLF